MAGTPSRGDGARVGNELREDYLRARLAYLSGGARTRVGPRRGAIPEVSHQEVSHQRVAHQGVARESPARDWPLPDAGPGAPAGPPVSVPDAEQPPLRPVPGSRLTRRHVQVLGVLAGLALVVCGWFVFGSRADVQAIQVRTAAGGPSPPPAPVPSPGLSTSPSRVPALTPAPAGAAAVVPIRVHVWGAVIRPGVVRLRPGDRVADAIASAGGLGPDADPAQLNLAEPVPDGAQVVIGTRRHPRGELRPPGPASSVTAEAGAGSPDGPKVNLNRATQSQLEALPGIGPVTAGRILAWRAERGRFSSVAELQEVSGIGPKLFAQIEPLVVL